MSELYMFVIGYLLPSQYQKTPSVFFRLAAGELGVTRLGDEKGVEKTNQ
jgi:hypothetical protein